MIDKIRWVLEHSDSPIMVAEKPETREDAIRNFRCFSDEGRAEAKAFESAIQFPSFPPITRCYGWLKIDTEKLPRRFHHYLQQERHVATGPRVFIMPWSTNTYPIQANMIQMRSRPISTSSTLQDLS